MKAAMPAAMKEKRQEWLVQGFIVGMALAFLYLGFSNLSIPSLWHDELVHVFTAQSILDIGIPRLPSGVFYANALAYNYLLSAMMALFGSGETAVRALSVLAGTVNIFLAYYLFRVLFKHPIPAMGAAVGMALCPWTLSWAREARFYSLQQMAYLLSMSAAWDMMTGKTRKDRMRGLAGLVGAVGLGLAFSVQSLFFLGPVGTYAFVAGIAKSSNRERGILIGIALFLVVGLLMGVMGYFSLLGGWLLLGIFFSGAGYRLFGQWVAITALVALAILGLLWTYHIVLPSHDQGAIFAQGGLSGSIPSLAHDPDRADPLYYIHFFSRNLSTGFLLMALLGFAVLPFREGWRGGFIFFAFWIPVLVLSYIGYRRYRFMFFAFPFYSAACAYGVILLFRWIRALLPLKMSRPYRFAALRVIAAGLLLVFGARLLLSASRLLRDDLRIASGTSHTLARRHPLWRSPCRYVKKQASREKIAIVSTTVLPVLYYVGRCDAWYSSLVVPWEVVETSCRTLRRPEDFETFIKQYPRGYYLAEYRRFDYLGKKFPREIQWVKKHLTRIDVISNRDVTVYAWGVP